MSSDSMSKVAGLSQAYLQLSRPWNVLIAAVSVLVGSLASGMRPEDPAILLACSVAALITAGANAINDVCDVEIDRINRPQRPLPSGRLKKTQATIFAAVLFVLGVIISLFLGTWGLSIALGVAALMVAYSIWLKRTLLWGNVAVALAAALAFVYGGMAVRRLEPALIPAGFAFLFHLGREILKDAEDVAGDRASGARTLATSVGIDRALSWAALAFLMLILASPLPFVAGYYSHLYVISVILGVDIPLVSVIFSSKRNHSPDHLGRLSRLLKMDMWVGLMAILAGVWM